MRAGLMLLAVAAAALQGVASQERRIVRLSAERFAFTPSHIEIVAGEEVELRIKSDDTSHGFRLVGTGTNITIPKRGKGEATVMLRIENPGRYVFECSRMCGAGHNFMRGELTVRPATTGAASR